MFGRSKTRAYLSLSLPLFALSYLVAVYFNSDFIFYNSNRITCTVTCVFMMLFLLSEAKLAMGQESYAFHFATALAFIVAGSAYVIPMLALVFFWEINMSLTTMTELSFIGFIIYAAFSAANSVRTLEKAKKES
jgi:hypothetical protein